MSNMRKNIILLGIMCMLMSLGLSAQSVKREFRGAWIQCVNGQFQGMGTQQMQKTLAYQLDELQKDGANAIIFQVRPACDALYESSIEPWSHFLTGVQGKAPVPYWDPLQWMIDECHKRGMELHAWINPYRAKTKSSYTLASNHIVTKHPEWSFRYDGLVVMNPALQENRDYICKVVEDIVKRYDIDGLHIDDYFYPSGLPMEYDAASYQASRSSLSQADWRRENINELVSEMYSAVKKADSDCVFGISPRGVVSQDYNLVYADVEYWASHEGYCDYLAPQIYYGFEHSTADYAKTIRQWSEMTTAKGVSLRIGLAAYKAGNTDRYAGNGANEWVENNNIIARQINLSRQYDNVEGLILFDYKQIFSEPNDAMKIEKKNFTALLK